jgi:prolyl-tRNA synthetase
MRMSKLFFKTLREVPSDAEFASHQLLVRAGMIRQVAAGIFEFLPLGYRVKHKVESIVRAEMDAIDGQEIAMPVVQPAELWQRSGRWYEIGDDMARLRDWAGRDLCLGMTHEEVVTDLAAQIIASYRQLPFMVYQIQTKFRDEPRSRGGLIRVREFTMKDAYSFHTDLADLDAYYPRVYQAYFNIFRRAGLDVMAVGSDTGMMGGTMAHEFMALAPVGEDTLVLCDACGYRANRQVARFRKPAPTPEDACPLEPVHTPGTTTIEEVASFLGVPATRTAKAVFMVAEMTDAAASPGATREQFVFAVVRGDMELNETKLANAIGARGLRPATVEEIRAAGAEPGFGSPIGVDRARVLLVVDDLVVASPNLVGGANRVDYHLRHVNHGRDYQADVVTDLVAAADGHACARCGAPLRTARGIEVGNVFKLGTKYSEAMGATYVDPAGDAHPMVMGCYGIGIGRLMASVVEQRHDDAGIVWPVTIAPYHVSLLALGAERDPAIGAAADGLYDALAASGVEVLYDDRPERAGVKFNDADLIGLPLRMTVGAKGLSGGTLEVRVRSSGETRSVPVADAVGEVIALLARLRAEIGATLRPEPLEE